MKGVESVIFRSRSPRQRAHDEILGTLTNYTWAPAPAPKEE